MSAARSNLADLRQRAQATYLVLRRSPHEDLRSITVIVRPYVVSLHDLDAVALQVRADVDVHETEHRRALMAEGTISRNAQGGQTRWAAVLELDLLHPRIACSEIKAELLAQWGIDMATLGPDQRVLLLHTHGVTDCRGHRSPEALARSLRKMWPGPRRVHVAKLWETGTIAENLERLAGYACKRVHRYSTAWGGRRTTYHGDYGADWKGFVEAVYDAIGNQKLLTANISTQACGREASNLADDDSPRMYHPRPGSVAEIAGSQAEQLSMPDDGQEPKAPSMKPSTPKERPTIMRAHQFIEGYVQPDTIRADALRDLQNALVREGPFLTSAERAIMYGDEAADLRIEQQRLDIAKTRAEIDKLLAAADRDRAEARASLRRSTSSSAVPPTRPHSSDERGASPGGRAPRPVAGRGTTRSTTRKGRSSRGGGSDTA